MATANLSTPLMVGQTGYTLTCGVSGASKLSPVIVWIKNGRTLTQVDNSTVLPFTPLSLSHAGNYTCSITSTLLNHPVMAANSEMVIIQSEYSLCSIIISSDSFLDPPCRLEWESWEGLAMRLE